MVGAECVMQIQQRHQGMSLQWQVLLSYADIDSLPDAMLLVVRCAWLQHATLGGETAVYFGSDSFACKWLQRESFSPGVDCV